MTDRWELKKNEIIWKVKQGAHVDNMEMAGKKLAAVVYYGTNDDGSLYLRKRIFYPTLRTTPNHTHASLVHEYQDGEYLKISVNGAEVKEYVYEVRIKGLITIYTRDVDRNVKITRYIYPSTDKMVYIEHTVVTNTGNAAYDVTTNNFQSLIYERGTKGVYPMEVESKGAEKVRLDKGQSVAFDTYYSARLLLDEKEDFNGVVELQKRREFVEKIFNDSLVLETDDPILNCEFNYSKFRISESIFDTMKGPMHGPGGQMYYAAIWANDEAEYAAPYYGFAGYDYADKATINVMDLYKPFMHPNLYHIPSSIIAEGLDIWEDPGDCGDASMYLYGMTRYLLQKGDKALAEKYFETIDWCVRFIATKENEFHVISSDSDELENRLPSGNANLLNSSLAYGGLVTAYYLAKDLGLNDKAKEYSEFAARLRDGIDNFFGADIAGYKTYKYCDENAELRSYMCAPLTVGIYDRKEGVVNAMLDKLWTENGLLSSENDKMFWDRSTLYALRGIFASGFSDKGYKYLDQYTHQRLLGDHVPYPIEAWPEGNQRHLSAEGGLYCRIIIEGMLGINPTGLRSFTITPNVPARLGKIALRKIKAFGGCFDVEVERNGKKYEITVTNADGITQVFHEVPADGTIDVTL